ncbi:hypothetical protein ACFLV7_07415 [Chloroflexota bacterium]
MVVARDSSNPLASTNSWPNFTALIKAVLEKDILTNHYLNGLSLFPVAHNDIISALGVLIYAMHNKNRSTVKTSNLVITSGWRTGHFSPILL